MIGIIILLIIVCLIMAFAMTCGGQKTVRCSPGRPKVDIPIYPKIKKENKNK